MAAGVVVLVRIRQRIRTRIFSKGSTLPIAWRILYAWA
jgi:hypothetical protein